MMSIRDLANLIETSPQTLIQFVYKNGRRPLMWIESVSDEAVYGFPINPDGLRFIEETPLFRINPDWVESALATRFLSSQITRVDAEAEAQAEGTPEAEQNGGGQAATRSESA